MASAVTTEMHEVAERYPAVLKGSLRKRRISWLVAAGIVGYLMFAWWFFSIGTVFANAKWDIAGAYLADWVSYEVRPNIDLREDHLEVKFTRFDPLGPNGNPDWLARETAMIVKSAPQAGGAGGGVSSSSGSFLGPAGGATAPAGSDGATPIPSAAATPIEPSEEVVRATVDFSGAGTVDIRPDRVTVTRGDETLVLDIVRDVAVNAQGPLPSWATQRSPGDKVVVYFGVPGRAEIESDEVKIRHRFLGWANFVFDINSPFWGKSAGEVFDLVVSGDRVEPSRSNLSLAWNNFLYNAEWQHLDVWTKLLETIVMAFAGTVLASLVAFPLAFIAARNIMPNRVLNQVAKRFFDLQRSVDMLIWALFFTRAFGPGPLAGISAIFFTDTGTFGKLYSEALENIDDKQREGVRSVGASPTAVQRYGVVPQVLPVFLSQSLYFWESNTRSATILGAVGAGGIGLKLWEAIRTNSDWENVAYMVILILIVVFVFDNISTALRQRLISPPGAAS
ncbi:MAG: phosphonate ABC transporter, permease protein PhnE [Mesorhizobium sp.]|nr:phosphonate ABC transporter, permease protein PhnE [Mesorhizobium sp.]